MKRKKRTFYLRRWLDAHTHFRCPDPPWCNDAFDIIVESIVEQCSAAVIMPNLPMIKTLFQMLEYREKIISVAKTVAPNVDFNPLMTLCITKDTTEEDIFQAVKQGCVGGKLYPFGMTTNSQDGTSDFTELREVLGWMEKAGMRLLIHCEDPTKGVDVIHTEEMFIMKILPVIRGMYKGPIVIEHCSTLAAINAVLSDNMMWGTLTPHHLVGNASKTIGKPFNGCKPVWQTEEQRKNVLSAVYHALHTGLFTHKFFAGSDTAPQLASTKLCEDGNFKYGCFTAPVSLQLYFQAFIEASGECYDEEVFCEVMDKFLYKNGAKFYGLEVNECNISTEMFDGAAIIISEEPTMAPASDDFIFYDYRRFEQDSFAPPFTGEMLQFSIEFLS